MGNLSILGVVGRFVVSIVATDEIQQFAVVTPVVAMSMCLDNQYDPPVIQSTSQTV